MISFLLLLDCYIFLFKGCDNWWYI